MFSRLSRKTIARLSTPSHNYYRVSTRRWWPFIQVVRGTQDKCYGLTSVTLSPGESGHRTGSVNERWQDEIEFAGQQFYSQWKYKKLQDVHF